MSDQPTNNNFPAYKPELEYTEQGWRYPVDRTRHHRENGWDYHGRAIYHFTLVVEERYPLFGVLEGDSPETAQISLNAFGRRAHQMLRDLPKFYGEKGFALKVLAFKVMPDHLHLVIQVLEPLPKSIGTVVRGFKSACTKLYKQEYFPSGDKAAKLHEGPAEAQGLIGNADSSAEVFVQFSPIFAGRGSIWQQNAAYYHERILHAPGQLRRMIDYVKDNPRRLWLKRHNPDLFKMHRKTEVCGLSFTSMGNHFLLDWPDRQMIEVSRSATDEQVEQQLKKALAAAHNGAITYTAAISKGEQRIARTLREQGFPLVVLLTERFPEEGSPKEKYYKPGGAYFEACSMGRLLLLEPSEQSFIAPFIRLATEKTLRHKAEAKHFSFTPIPETSQRYRFVALNEMIRRLLAGE